MHLQLAPLEGLVGRLRALLGQQQADAEGIEDSEDGENEEEAESHACPQMGDRTKRRRSVMTQA